MIEELERFIIAAKEGNITRASEKIFITQSALSQSIKRLEIELGTQLFSMHGKRLQVTDDGKATIIIGTKILQLWNNAKNPTIRSHTKKTYAVGLFDNAALYLGNYLQENLTSEKYTIELTINSSSNLFSQLYLGTLDFAVCVSPVNSSLQDKFVVVDTFKEELIPVSSKVFKGDIETFPFILYNQGSHTRDQVNTVFKKNALQPKIFAESTSTTFMKELAMLGSGIALLPRNFVRAEMKQKIIKRHPLPFKVYREYGFYKRKQSEITSGNEIIQAICKVLKKTSI